MRAQIPEIGRVDAGDDVIRRVLVVDDSRAQRRILTASLTRWGFDVREADSGEVALGICDDYAPDLVLSDWMMPGMTGLEFCRAFRDMPRDACLTYEDVEVPPGRLIERLRAEQEARFGSTIDVERPNRVAAQRSSMPS